MANDVTFKVVYGIQNPIEIGDIKLSVDGNTKEKALMGKVTQKVKDAMKNEQGLGKRLQELHEKSEQGKLKKGTDEYSEYSILKKMEAGSIGLDKCGNYTMLSYEYKPDRKLTNLFNVSDFSSEETYELAVTSSD